MTYIQKNNYFGQLIGSNANRVGAGSNGALAPGSGVKAVLTLAESKDWITSNNNNNEFTVENESIIFGFSVGSNTGADFYHRYIAVGGNLTITHGAMTNAEAAGSASKIDEDILAVCSSSGTFSIECTGKYNGGYFCDEGTRIFLLRSN